MSKSNVHDINDRRRSGSLPSDPEDESVPITSPNALRDATMELVREETDPAKLSEPNDVHAEASLIGALLWTAKWAPGTLNTDHVADVIDATMFFSGAHHVTFAAIAELHAAGAQCDAVSVHGALVAKEEQRVAPIAYLERMAASGGATIEQARTWAASIQATAVRRRLAESARKIMDIAKRGKHTAPDAVRVANAEMQALLGLTLGDAGLVTARQAAREFAEDLARPKSPALVTDSDGVQAYLGGLFVPSLTVVAASTSDGKSMFANQLCQGVARLNDGVGVLYFPLEMTAKKFAARTASAESGVDGKRIRRNELSHDELTRVAGALNEFGKRDMLFTRQRAQTITSIRNNCQSAAHYFARHGKKLRVVVIDHTRLVRREPERAGTSSNDHLEHVSSGLLDIAAEFECAVIACAQINRSAKKQVGDQTPRIEHIYGSSAFEQDADNIIILYPKRDHRGMRVDEWTQVLVPKARDDQTGSFWMRTDPRTGRLENVRPGDEPPADRSHVQQRDGRSNYQRAQRDYRPRPMPDDERFG